MLLTLNTVMQERAATLLRLRLHFGFLSSYNIVLHDSPWNFLWIFVSSALKDSKKFTFKKKKKDLLGSVFWLLTVQLHILTNVLRWRLHDDVFHATLSHFSLKVSDSLRPYDCSPPDTSVHGILQAILLWIAIPFSRGSSQPWDRIHVSYVFWIGRQVITTTTWESPWCFETS